MKRPPGLASWAGEREAMRSIVMAMGKVLLISRSSSVFDDHRHEAVGLVFYPRGAPLRVRPRVDGAGQSSQLDLF